MSDKETKERIEKEAEAFAGTHYTRNHFPKNWNDRYQSYIAGATSERPKAWNEALDAAIERIPKEWNHYATLSDIINTLEQLKHKQP